MLFLSLEGNLALDERQTRQYLSGQLYCCGSAEKDKMGGLLAIHFMSQNWTGFLTSSYKLTTYDAHLAIHLTKTRNAPVRRLSKTQTYFCYHSS